MKHRLHTSKKVDGYCLVNGRPHGFKTKKQYEVTFKFDSIEERKQFIRIARQEWGIYLARNKKPLESDETRG